MDAIAAPRPLSPAKYSDSFMLRSVASRFVYHKHQATSKASKMLCMKTTDEIRYENLQRLVAEAGDLSTLVDRAKGKLSRPTLYQILERKTTAAGVEKNVGDDLARKIEDALRLERGWMDNDHTQPVAAALPSFSPEELADMVMVFCQTNDIGRKGIKAAVETARMAALASSPTTGNQFEVRSFPGNGGRKGK